MGCNTSRELFNDGWLFALDTADLSAPGYDDSAMRRLDLPHDWQIEQKRSPDAPDGGSQGYYPRAGIGWYRKHFTAPADWKDKSVTLTFDGVQRFSTVYLNGIEIGGRKYGYVQFDCSLSEELNIGGENVLAVKVDNSDCGPDRWYSGAGIYRNVWIAVENKLRIAPRGVWATPSEEGGRWKLNTRVFTRNDSGEDAAARFLLDIKYKGSLFFSGEYEAALHKGENESEFTAEVGEPVLWDCENPALYDLSLILESGGERLSEYNAKTGFRTAKFDDDKGFLLNGGQVKLYGGDFHHDGGGFGAAVPIKVWRRRFERLKSIGGNAVRCSHNPQCEEFYALCDEMGILCIDELYDKWTEMYYARLFETDRFDDLRSMVSRDINHPSVILWSVGNELGIQYSEKFYEYLSGLCSACRKLDPSRGVSYALIGFCLPNYNDSTPLETKLEAVKRYGDIVDVFMGNYMENYYAALRAYGMKRAVIGSEVFTYYRHAELSTTQVIAQTPWDDVARNDWVAGGFVWSACDYIGEAATGWPAVGWTGAPIDAAGFIKHRGYYLQSRWAKKPMVYTALFDEREKWDMAHVQWGFPQMTAFWNGLERGKVIHVGVYTNCPMVKIYYHSDKPCVASSETPDGMAHFYIPFFGGGLLTVGCDRDGNELCRQELAGCDEDIHLELKLCDADIAADGRDIMQIEAEIKDKLGQRRELEGRNIAFYAEGEGKIAVIDNGDFTDPDKSFTSHCCRMNGGRALAVIRSTKKAGKITLTAAAEGLPPVTVEFASK